MTIRCIGQANDDDTSPTDDGRRVQHHRTIIQDMPVGETQREENSDNNLDHISRIASKSQNCSQSRRPDRRTHGQTIGGSSSSNNPAKKTSMYQQNVWLSVQNRIQPAYRSA